MTTEQITNSIPPELMAWLTETFSSFAAIAVVVFLAFALWGAFQGFRRSIFRQVIHVVVTFITAVIAFSLTSGTCDTILAAFTEITTAEFVSTLEVSLAQNGVFLSEEVKAILLCFDMSSVGYAISLIFNTIAAPAVFAILFAIVAIIGKVVTSIVCFFVPKGQTLTYKILGLVGGIVEGALIAGVVLLPLVGWVNLAGGAVDVIRDNAPADDEGATEIVEFYDEIVAPLEKHVIFQMVGSLGGNDALDKISTIEIDGQDKDLRNEFDLLIKLCYDVTKLNETDFLALTEGDKSAIDNLIADCDDSVVISRVACGIVNGFAKAISEGAIPVQVTDNYYNIIMEAVDILGSENTNPDTLGENLTTFKNIYFILSDDGVLAIFDTSSGTATVTEDQLTEALTKKDEDGNTVLNKIINELDKNENTRSLIPLVGKLAMAAIYDSLGIPEGSEEAYETVKESMQEILTTDTTDPEAAKEVITESLTETLESIGIPVTSSGAEGSISEEDVETIAEYLIEKQDEIKEKLEQENINIENISDADILNVLLNYYSSILEGNNQ